MIVSCLLTIALASLAAPTPYAAQKIRKIVTGPSGCPMGSGGSGSPPAPLPPPVYGGPGDQAPRGTPYSGPGAPSSPGPAAPAPSGPRAAGGGPGSASPGAPAPASGCPTSGGGGFGAASSDWSRWWHFNREAFLKADQEPFPSLPTTGEDADAGGLRPTESQVRSRIVPALVGALSEKGVEDDLVNAVLLALARIGEAQDDGSIGRLFVDYLDHRHRGVAENACVALGVLGEPSAVPLLGALLDDTTRGRKLCGRTETPDRMRAFAAYGLGLVAERSSNPDVRRYVVNELLGSLEDGDRPREVRLACMVALGLSSPEAHGRDDVRAADAPGASNTELARRLIAYLEDRGNDDVVRAQAPASLARLLPHASPEARAAVVGSLQSALAKFSQERSGLVRQSSALALGRIGDCDEDELDEEIRETLMRVAGEGDLQTRHFAILALGQIAARPGDGKGDPLAASRELRRALLAKLANASSATRGWAALAIGVAGFELRARKESLTPDELAAVRRVLQDTRSRELAPVYALAAGLGGDGDALATVVESLEGHARDAAHSGPAVLALGLMGRRSAIEPLRAMLHESKHDPAVFEDVVVALRLLRDQRLVEELREVLGECDCALSQATVAAGLARTQDARAVPPLMTILEERDGPQTKRAWAALALGRVADRRALPWPTRIAADLNYQAREPSLTSPEGAGILDYR